MLLDHSHPECTGKWRLNREGGGRSAVSCVACGASYPRTAWAEDAGVAAASAAGCEPPYTVPHTRFPSADSASSTARLAVALLRSRMGFTSTMSRPTIRPVSASISAARWASR